MIILPCGSLSHLEKFPWKQFHTVVEYQQLTINLESYLLHLKQRIVFIRMVSLDPFRATTSEQYPTIEETEEWIAKVRYQIKDSDYALSHYRFLRNN